MKELLPIDTEYAAKMLNLEPAIIKAVVQVESKGKGFITRDPKLLATILFEPHVFSRITGHKYDRQHPHISSLKSNSALYLGGEWEHRKLEWAKQLDPIAAIESCSWGAFQIMGFHWPVLGYESAQVFEKLMNTSVSRQLDAFCLFIKHNELAPLLRERKWSAFAKRYNGPGYKANQYDVRLERAYKHFRDQETDV